MTPLQVAGQTLETVTIAARGLEFPALAMGRGPMVICLHGFPDHLRSFRHQLPAIAAAGFRAIAPAMRGSDRILPMPSSRASFDGHLIQPITTVSSSFSSRS